MGGGGQGKKTELPGEAPPTSRPGGVSLRASPHPSSLPAASLVISQVSQAAGVEATNTSPGATLFRPEELLPPPSLGRPFKSSEKLASRARRPHPPVVGSRAPSAPSQVWSQGLGPSGILAWS